MPKERNRILMLQLFEAAVTTPGAHPPLLRVGGADTPLDVAFLSFWDRIHTPTQNRLYHATRESALHMIFYLFELLQMIQGGRVSAEAGDRLGRESVLDGSNRVHAVLSGLLQRGQAGAVAASLRSVWPASTLTLEDLMSVSHYIEGVLLLSSDRVDEAVAEFERAVAAPACGGLAWRVLWGVPTLLMEKRRYVTATSLCRTLLARYNAEENPDPMRRYWLATAAVQATALGSDWDPAEAHAPLNEADEEAVESKVVVWGEEIFGELYIPCSTCRPSWRRATPFPVRRAAATWAPLATCWRGRGRGRRICGGVGRAATCAAGAARRVRAAGAASRVGTAGRSARRKTGGSTGRGAARPRRSWLA